MYLNPNLPDHLTSLFPSWYPYVCSLHLCVYFCFVNIFKETQFNSGDKANGKIYI